MDTATNPAFLAFVTLSPLLIAFVKQSGFSQQQNALIALACYIGIGIAGALSSGTPVTIENATVLISVAVVLGSAAYNLVWSNLGKSTPTSLSFDAVLTAATSFVK